MATSTPIPPPNVLTLLLIGGGYAHIQVVKDLKIPHHVNPILVSESHRIVYAGMIPAVIAKLRPLEDAEVDLHALCKHHNWQFIQARCVGVCASKRYVRLQIDTAADAPSVRFSYDLLSINVGSTVPPIPGARIAGATANNLKIPMELATFPIAYLPQGVDNFERIASNIPNSRSQTVLVIGDGAAGVELAAALRARLRMRVLLAGRRRALVRNYGREVARSAAQALAQRGVELLDMGCVTHLDHGVAKCKNGSFLHYDLAVLATGTRAHEWLKTDTDLPCSKDGFIRVTRTLQSIAFGTVFAAGDCASFGDLYENVFPRNGSVPRAGVFAIRMGPVLTHNLKVALNYPTAAKMRFFVPQPQALTLLALGDGTAFGGKYGIIFGPATWCYCFKRYLDHSWQSMFKPPESGIIPLSKLCGFTLRIRGFITKAVLLLGQLDAQFVDSAGVGHEIALGDRPEWHRIALLHSTVITTQYNAHPTELRCLALLHDGEGWVVALLHEPMHEAVTESYMSLGLIFRNQWLHVANHYNQPVVYYSRYLGCTLELPEATMVK